MEERFATSLQIVGVYQYGKEGRAMSHKSPKHHRDLRVKRLELLLNFIGVGVAIATLILDLTY